MGVDGSVDISVEQRHTILSLLRRHLPDTTVWVYGSRAKWTARPQSDLDMVVLTPLEQARQVSRLKEAFEQSSLPFRVDLFIWDEVPKSFQREIEAEHVVLAKATIKQAEDDWRYSHWGDIATLEYGRALKAYRSTEGPFRVFGTNGPIGWHDEAICNHASVIVGRKGAYRGVHYSSAPFFVIDTAFYLEPKEEIDVRWAHYSLLTQDIDRMDSGSAIPSTSREDFYRLSVSIPPLPEQCAIARILGTLDDKIELNRSMSETLEAIARALFKDWFVDFGPVRAKVEGRSIGLPRHVTDLFPNKLVDSNLGEIPDGWIPKPLGHLIELRYGKALKAAHRQHDGDVPVYGSNGQVGWHNNSLATGPGIVVGRKGNPGTITWVHSNFYPIDTAFYVVPKSDSYTMHFLHYALKHQDLASLAADSAVPGLNRNLAYMSKQVVPAESLLQHFTIFSAHLLSKIHQLEKESRILASIRDILLPKLISGEIRVREAEKIVESVA